MNNLRCLVQMDKGHLQIVCELYTNDMSLWGLLKQGN